MASVEQRTKGREEYLSSVEEFKLKRKQYKEDLKQFISNTLTEYYDNIPDFDAMIKEFSVSELDERLRDLYEPSVLLPGLSKLIPILNVCKFICINRTLVFVKGEDIRESIKYDKVLSAGEVYDALKRLTPIASTSVLGKLRCEYEQIESLQKSFAESDREQFVAVFNSTSCDKSLIYFICNSFPLEKPLTTKDVYSNEDYLENIETQYDYYVSWAANHKEDDWYPLLKSFYEALHRMREIAEAVTNSSLPDNDDSVNSFVSEFKRLLGTLISCYKRYVSFALEDGFLFEKEMLSEMIGQLQIDDFLHKYERFELQVQTSIELSSKEVLSKEPPSYKLPSDLFDGKVDTTNAYIPGLKNDLKSVEKFEQLFDFILNIGGITSEEEAGALLRAFTGYPIENANQKAKWESDYHILFYLVKYMFTPKERYVKMSQCIDIYYPSEDERRKAEKFPSSYAERIGGDDAPYIIETLNRIYSVFPKLETPITD